MCLSHAKLTNKKTILQPALQPKGMAARDFIQGNVEMLRRCCTPTQKRASICKGTSLTVWLSSEPKSPPGLPPPCIGGAAKYESLSQNFRCTDWVRLSSKRGPYARDTWVLADSSSPRGEKATKIQECNRTSKHGMGRHPRELTAFPTLAPASARLNYSDDVVLSP